MPIQLMSQKKESECARVCVRAGCLHLKIGGQTALSSTAHAAKSEPTYYVRLGIAVCVVGACVGDVAYGVRYYEKSVHSHGRSDE